MRFRRLELPGRGAGALALLDFGPAHRPVDAVFLHANGFNAMTYRRVLAPLASEFRILAVDQRGHGASSLPTVTAGRGDWLDLRDDLLAAMERLGLVDVVLCGHSMGGTVCLLAAASAPERVRRLVLFDPVILPPEARGRAVHGSMVEAAGRRRAVFPSRAAALAAYKGRGAFKDWPDDTLADYVTAGFVDLPNGDVVLACEPEWEASGYASHGHDSWRAFAESRCRIDIYLAERESTCHLDRPSGEGRIHVAVVAGSSHFLPMERPDVVQQALRAALTSSDRA